MKLKSLLILLCSLAAGVFSPAVQANWCNYDAGQGPVRHTVPLITANISVGVDVPVGTVIHRQRMNAPGDSRPNMTCYAEGGPSFTWDQYLNLINTPALVAGWGGVYAGALYQTSVAGIGLAITNNDGYGVGTALTTARFLKWVVTVPGGTTLYYPPVGHSVVLNFVKTGPISAGVINGASFPTVLMTTGATLPITGSAAPPSTPYTINFSGAMSVVVNTCRTPDVLVPMGKYQVSQYFKGKGSTTPWVSMPIALQACPPFYGAYSNAANSPLYSLDGTQNPGTRITNTVTLGFMPNYGAIDSANGIIKLDNDPNVATGVGIQLGASSNPASPGIDLSRTFNFPMTSSAVGSVSIRFYARYIQTKDIMTPGPANSKATFTVSYY